MFPGIRESKIGASKIVNIGEHMPETIPQQTPWASQLNSPRVGAIKKDGSSIHDNSIENIGFDKPPVFGVRNNKKFEGIIDSKSFGSLPQPSGNFSINELEDVVELSPMKKATTIRSIY